MGKPSGEGVGSGATSGDWVGTPGETGPRYGLLVLLWLLVRWHGYLTFHIDVDAEKNKDNIFGWG